MLSSARNALLGLLTFSYFGILLVLQVSAQESPPLQRDFLAARLIWPSPNTFFPITMIISYVTLVLICSLFICSHICLLCP